MTLLSALRLSIWTIVAVIALFYSGLNVWAAWKWWGEWRKGQTSKPSASTSFWRAWRQRQAPVPTANATSDTRPGLSIYLVTVTLNPGVTVDTVERLLHQAHGYTPCMGASWLICTNESVALWNARLLEFTWPYGRQLVTRLAADRMIGQMPPGFWTWIQQHVSCTGHAAVDHAPARPAPAPITVALPTPSKANPEAIRITVKVASREAPTFWDHLMRDD